MDEGRARCHLDLLGLQPGRAWALGFLDRPDSLALPVDEEIAQQALLLRSASSHRLPTIDCLIAATAAVQRVTLVHRDPHFTVIPEHYLKQLQLPDK